MGIPVRLLIFALLLVMGLHTACRDPRFTVDGGDRISFSTDTLRFDTVFTRLGSATRILKVYNPNRDWIRLSGIYLESGAASRFNLNVDGLPGDSHADLEIAPGDSLYIFVEVTINPDDPVSVSPFVLQEFLVVAYNGNEDRVILEAWGQNAVYLPSRFGAGGVASFNCNGGEWVWDDPRPYIIYGILVIDDCTLRIPAGARVYTHGGLAKAVDPVTGSSYRYNDGFLAVVGSGRLVVEGSRERPVIFEDDRPEAEFDAVAGQWTGIWLQAGTRGNRIEHCIIRNSIIGVRVDSAAELRLKDVQVYQTAGSGLIGVHAEIRAENCLFYRNTGFSIQLEYGGDYFFDYCTATSFGVDGEALRMSNVLCRSVDCAEFSLFPLRARFRNCILTGSRPDQVSLENRSSDATLLDYSFAHCLVKVRDLIKPNAYPEFLSYCQPCLNLTVKDTVFLDIGEDNFRLDTLRSRANRFGTPIPTILKDLDGKQRDLIAPDAGCFEIEF